MLLFEQLQLLFFPPRIARGTLPEALVRKAPPRAAEVERPPRSGRDAILEGSGREMLQRAGAGHLGPNLRVEWNRRLRTAAGRADYARTIVSLNPRLSEYGVAEIDRTLRHELAHLLAHARAGRRRISPHGPEWRQACADLGIADEKRCHSLPFPTQRRRPRHLYRCPKCARDFPRVRPIRRAVACVACCRRHNRGRYARQFQLQLVQPESRR